MMSDLPHVMYHPKEVYSEEVANASKTLRKDIQEKTKKGGLAAALGLNVASAQGGRGVKVNDGKMIAPSQAK